MKKWLITGLFVIAGFIQAYAQQDAQFSQYMFNGIYINPAYAGYRKYGMPMPFTVSSGPGFRVLRKPFHLR